MYNREFSNKINIKTSKNFGIRKDFTILFLMTFIFASKILFMLGVYMLMLIFTFTISFITFIIMLTFSSTYKVLKKIYYTDTKNILIPVEIDHFHMLSATSFETLNKSKNSSILDFGIKFLVIYEKIQSRDFSKLSVIFILIFVTYLLLFYSIISAVFFIDSIINTVMTSTALQYRLF